MDNHAMYELRLHIENSEQLYRSQMVPIIKNVQRRMKKGTYDHGLAPKLWQYLVDNGARNYCKLYGGSVRWVFPVDMRRTLAQEFADDYRDEIELCDGDYIS